MVISGITLVFIGIGEINRLATMSTMPFLITYGVIEYSYFVLCMQFDLNQVYTNDYHIAYQAHLGTDLHERQIGLYKFVILESVLY